MNNYYEVLKNTTKTFLVQKPEDLNIIIYTSTNNNDAEYILIDFENKSMFKGKGGITMIFEDNYYLMADQEMKEDLTAFLMGADIDKWLESSETNKDKDQKMIFIFNNNYSNVISFDDEDLKNKPVEFSIFVDMIKNWD